MASGGGTGGLRLLRLNTVTGRLAHVPGGEAVALGRVRSLAAVRPAGASRDVLVVGSDSGAVTILEVRSANSGVSRTGAGGAAAGGSATVASVTFKVLHCEVFGRSGLRRIVPGQFVAADPNGRAVMLAALEKSKVVYILNRGSSTRADADLGMPGEDVRAPSAAELTISSPLEAHEAQRAVIDLVAVDVGFDNPLFACLEIVYPEDDDAEREDAMGAELSPKRVVFWELDLGLNTMVKRVEIPVSRSAHRLVAVPGGDDGPGGLLVCSAGGVTYFGDEDRQPIFSAFPRRRGAQVDPEHTASTYGEEGTLIVSVGSHRQPGLFLFLLQNEQGDVFKLTLETDGDGEVRNIRQSYFETLPLANALVVLRAGFLFVATETGNHLLFEFVSLGDEGEISPRGRFVQFEPRSTPQYLELADEVASLAPLIDIQVAPDADDAAMLSSCRMLALCGRGGRSSSLKVLRHGLPTSELAVSPLPEAAVDIWTLRHPLSGDVTSALDIPDGAEQADPIADIFHRHIVVSFEDSTLVLAVGETVEESSDTGFLTDTRTILAADIGAGERHSDASAVQVHSGGVRHVRLVSGTKAVSQWQPPSGTQISFAASNRWQILVSLDNGDLVLFEVNQSTGQLTEVGKMPSRRSVCALAIAPVSSGRRRARFAAMGDSRSNTVRMLSLESGEEDAGQPEFAQRVDGGKSSGSRALLSTVSVQTLPTVPTSLSLARLPTNAGSVAAAAGHSSAALPRELYLSIGLENGVLVRTTVDSVTGELQDARTRFLGGRPVKLSATDSLAGFSTAASAAAAATAREEAEELEEEESVDEDEVSILRKEADELTRQLLDRNTPHNGEADSVIALSSSPWLTYWNATHQRLQSMPLSYGTLDAVAPLASVATPAGGCVAISGNLMRVFSYDAAATDSFSVTDIPLQYTPRRLLLHPVTQHAVVLEAEQRQIVSEQKDVGGVEIKKESVSDDDMDMDMDMDQSSDDKSASMEGNGDDSGPLESLWTRGLIDQLPAGAAGQWASRVTVVDPNKFEVLDFVTLPQNEAALCAAFVTFAGREGAEVLLCVGTVSLLRFRPRREIGPGGQASIRTYRLVKNGTVFEELHCTALGTKIEDTPTAMTAFRGLLLVGTGRSLRLFGLGKKQLLRKGVSKDIVPAGIISIEVMAWPKERDLEGDDTGDPAAREESNRVVIGDGRFGIFMVQYDPLQNTFLTFADEIVPRNLNRVRALDYDTAVATDKFGNIHASRLAESISREVTDDATGAFIRTQAAVAQAAQSKGLGANAAVSLTQTMETISQFYLGEAVTALHVGPLVPGGSETILYGSMLGAIGALQPMTSREDIDFFQHLEMHLRQALSPLLGRDHLQFRSSYFPSKHVIDGQLCEQFALLPANVQHEIAEELDRSPADVLKKLEDVRNRIM